MWSLAARTFAISFLTLFMVATCAAQADAPHAGGKPSEKKTPDAASAPAAGAAGLVVFIDPITGKLVQPAPEDIGKLVAPQGTAPQGATVAPKAPVIFIYGPGSTVGMATPPEAFSYAIATTTPDGKLTLDCVTGEKAATDRMVSPNAKETPKAKGPLDEKR